MNGVFVFGISFSVLKILMFLYYANQDSDDIVNCATKIIKYWIKIISRDVGAVIFKLGTRRNHHEWNKMTSVVSLPWRLSWPQSLSVKNQISTFSTLWCATEGLALNRHGSCMVLTLLIRLLGVDGTWLRQKLWISILIKTRSAAKLLSWQQPHRCFHDVYCWCQVWRALLQYF